MKGSLAITSHLIMLTIRYLLRMARIAKAIDLPPRWSDRVCLQQNRLLNRSDPAALLQPDACYRSQPEVWAPYWFAISAYRCYNCHGLGG